MGEKRNYSDNGITRCENCYNKKREHPQAQGLEIGTENTEYLPCYLIWVKTR